MKRNGKSGKRHKYRRLKLSILVRTILITAIAGAIGTFVMVYFVDGFFDNQLPRFFVWFLHFFGTSESRAREIYWHAIGNNRNIFMIILFVIIFLIIFYGALSSLTGYLEDIEDCLDEVDSDSTEPFELIEELSPIEEKLNRLRSTLQQQKAEAAESERRKNDLLLFLAHDLKTPLTSVLAYLTRLDNMPGMEEQERKKEIHIAMQKAERLRDLLQEFFDLMRYNLQTIRLDRQVINLSLMLEQLADELYAVLEQKNLTCEVKADEDILLYGDPDKLARVFDNLLRNAVSYSYPGTVISIVAREVGDWTEIVFSNKGDTIPQESLDRIFEKFYRRDSSRSSETGGAGLGLAIAKEIVEVHGGKITVTSIDGETSFVVVLPREDEKVRREKEKRLEQEFEAARSEEQKKA